MKHSIVITSEKKGLATIPVLSLIHIFWGYDNSSDIRTVDVHIRRLREKLERTPASPEHIMTKWGVGYYFKF